MREAALLPDDPGVSSSEIWPRMKWKPVTRLLSDQVTK